MKEFKVKFQPEGLEIKVPEGKTLMEAINAAQIDFDFPCGGKGTCGKCRVRVLSDVDDPTPEEQKRLDSKELEDGIRLACRTTVTKDVIVEPIASKNLKHQILQTTEVKNILIKPHVNKTFIKVKEGSLEEHTPDWDRFKEALLKQGLDEKKLNVKISALKEFANTLRLADHFVTAVTYNNEVLGIEQGDTTKNLLGMAFDIGTTTVVGYLIDLLSGKELSVASTVNPQTKYGADVISRLSFTREEGGLDKLHSAIIEAINKLIKQASRQAGVSNKDIYAITIAGNTTMNHLFLGINPQYLSSSPYVSVYNDPVQVNASELNIEINEAGKILALPNIGGFVGADTVAVLVAAEMDKIDDIKLMIDIGTNGEIVLGSRKKMFACSAAAGPAFEGAEITFGMRGAEGAIDHIYFKDSLEYTMIGTGKPKGICGSALLDVVAGLIEVGIINKRGKLLSAEEITNPIGLRFKDHIVKYEDETAFLLVDGSFTDHGKSIVVTQNDVRQLQLAKGAMVTGVRILIEKLGINVEDIKEVLLAGAFGNYMSPHSACVIGLIPGELEDRIKMIGNAAGMGSRISLLSATEYERSTAIAKKVEHVELASYPSFRSIYAKATYF